MTQLVGILNVTPDSFSDGGQFVQAKQAVEQFDALVEAGAQVIDIGAESTRPGATPLSAAEEWARLAPVLAALTPRVPISVDTRHGEVAERALQQGATIINDVSGLADGRMRSVLAACECPVIVMHALTVPVDPAVLWPDSIDPVSEILRWKHEITARAVAEGIAATRLVYDPGLGFGKSSEQSMALIARASELVASGGAWYYGHSRKSFLKKPGDVPADRDVATLELSKTLVAAGVHYLRVHNVSLHAEALCM